ncbi:MAG: M14 family zinc carboxypeptidase [Acidobacteriota bacterium]
MRVPAACVALFLAALCLALPLSVEAQDPDAGADLSSVLAPVTPASDLPWSRSGARLAPLDPVARGELPQFSLAPLDATVPTPAAWLGYALGERFTQYPAALDYLEELASSSPRMTLWQYGQTYEQRVLRLAAISSPANLDRLEELRRRHLRLASGDTTADEREELSRDLPVFVWLAYGVHGNESSAMEAALATAYALTASSSEEVEKMLERVVVLLDPLANPDGRERYISGFLQRRGRIADPHRDSYEHEEPWPGGRFNHYLFDLNRDWPWMTQIESQHRVAAYRRWEPHVYVDVHEMEVDSTYYFPPAADPVLETIDRRVLDWLEVFGQANARTFDAQGWFYFDGERFDLFYPGYGDTYPSLRHSIGMTYEMAGHGFAGQIVERRDGTLLTLADRIVRHFTTSLATVATAAENRGGLVRDFGDARAEARKAPGTYFLWSGEGEGNALAQLLDDHGIEISRLAQPVRAVPARRVVDGDLAQRNFDAGTWALDTSQALGALAQTLMEREIALPEAFVQRQRQRLERHQEEEFADITSWSLPLAYGVEVFRSEPGTELPQGSLAAAQEAGEPQGGLVGRGSLAYLVRPQGLAGWRLTSWLQRESLRYSVATGAFENAGGSFPAGTLLVPGSSNGADLEASLNAAGERFGVEIVRVTSGLTASGISLGSLDMVTVQPPRIALVADDPTTPTAHGALWHLLDQQLEVPHHRIHRHTLDNDSALTGFDVLILPDGDWTSASLPESLPDTLRRWMERGGTLIAIGEAGEWLFEEKLSPFAPWTSERAGSGSASGNALTAAANSWRQSDFYTPGAAFATELSPQHPLTAGAIYSPSTLVLGSRVLLPVGDPTQDIARIALETPLRSGFAWPEAQERLTGSLVLGLEHHGDGQALIFAHDPSFRGFWRSSLPLLLNGVLHGPSLSAADRL